MSKHGRARIPFRGPYKGIQVSEAPSEFLSGMRERLYGDPEWQWLLSSVEAEMRHRGLHVAAIEPMPVFNLRCIDCKKLFESRYQRPRCDACAAAEKIAEHNRKLVGAVTREIVFP